MIQIITLPTVSIMMSFSRLQTQFLKKSMSLKIIFRTHKKIRILMKNKLLLIKKKYIIKTLKFTISISHIGKNQAKPKTFLERTINNHLILKLK